MAAKTVLMANQTARLRTTPATAAVTAVRAAERARLPRRSSMKGAPRKIEAKQGAKVTQVARRPPRVPARRAICPAGLAVGGEEADELEDHDQRAGGGLGHAEAVEHLAGGEPAVGADRLLGDVGEDGVGAAEGDDGHAGEEGGDVGEDVAGAGEGEEERDRHQPEREGGEAGAERRPAGGGGHGGTLLAEERLGVGDVAAGGAVPGAGREGGEAGALAEEADDGGREHDEREGGGEGEDGDEGEKGDGAQRGVAQRAPADADHRFEHDGEHRRLEADEGGGDRPELAVEHVEPAQGHDHDDAGEDEEDAGDQRRRASPCISQPT